MQWGSTLKELVLRRSKSDFDSSDINGLLQDVPHLENIAKVRMVRKSSKYDKTIFSIECQERPRTLRVELLDPQIEFPYKVFQKLVAKHREKGLQNIELHVVPSKYAREIYNTAKEASSNTNPKLDLVFEIRDEIPASRHVEFEYDSHWKPISKSKED